MKPEPVNVELGAAKASTLAAARAVSTSRESMITSMLSATECVVALSSSDRELGAGDGINRPDK